MKRTQIQLTEGQRERLDEVAREEGLSRAAVIRKAVDAWLAIHSTGSPDEKVDRAKEAVGRFGSGDSDVSERHDAYLEGGYES